MTVALCYAADSLEVKSTKKMDKHRQTNKCRQTDKPTNIVNRSRLWEGRRESRSASVSSKESLGVAKCARALGGC